MNLNKTFVAVQNASRGLLALSDKDINRILLAVADAAIAKADFILSENRKDLERMDPANPKYDRLKLTEARLQGIAADMRNVATLPSPLGRVLKENILPNGLKIKRISVPFGVIGIIYEARPNVSFDVFSLCLKSGNACILKGGSDADCSNRAIVGVIHEVLEHFGIDPHIVELLPADREATAELLHANGYVDLIIPRGSSNLINFVRQNATIPVIETGAGICHTFFDRYGDVTKGAAIINNAKTRRVNVCNALDCLLVDADRLQDLPALCAPPAKGQRDNLCRCTCIRRPEEPLSGRVAERSYRRGFRHRVPGLQDGSKSGIVHARSPGAHTEIRFQAQRMHRDGEPGTRRTVLPRCRCRLCLRQCPHFVYGRSAVRSGRRNRHQHSEAACSRPDGVGRDNHL